MSTNKKIILKNPNPISLMDVINRNMNEFIKLKINKLLTETPSEVFENKDIRCQITNCLNIYHDIYLNFARRDIPWGYSVKLTFKDNSSEKTFNYECNFKVTTFDLNEKITFLVEPVDEDSFSELDLSFQQYSLSHVTMNWTERRNNLYSPLKYIVKYIHGKINEEELSNVLRSRSLEVMEALKSFFDFNTNVIICFEGEAYHGPYYRYHRLLHSVNGSIRVCKSLYNTLKYIREYPHRYPFTDLYFTVSKLTLRPEIDIHTK